MQITEEEAFDFTKRVLGNSQLRAVEELVIKQSWLGKSYAQIASAHDYDYGYIKDVGSQLWQVLSKSLGEPVKKKTLKSVLSQQYQQWQNSQQTVFRKRQHWGDAIDVSNFYGRTTELKTLTNWVMKDRCRMVAVLGMGGMGKTSLVAKFARQQQAAFDCLVWRSLLSAPTLSDLLNDLLQSLSPQPLDRSSADIPAQISELLNLLQQQRCLVILDNMESIFQQGTTVGTYLDGYEKYQDLFKKLAEVGHQSCVIITSREQPQEVALGIGSITAVRALSLPGIQLIEGQAIFADQGFVAIDDQDISAILKHYGGNPLALKIVAAGIQEMRGGDLCSLLPHLSTSLLQFADINDVLHRQLQRISPSEQVVMYWLMINRAPVSLNTLATDIYPSTSIQLPQLLLTLQALKRRSLIEYTDSGWYLQPVVMEFITAHVITKVTEEIISVQPEVLCHVALLKSHSPNHIRQTQIRLVLQPILELLSQRPGINTESSIQAIRLLLMQLQQTAQPFPAYAPGNLLNLLKQMAADWKYLNLNCSQLPIWQTDFVGSTLQNTNFSQATFQDCLFTQPFSAVLNVIFSPDGQLLAASNANGEIQIWRLQDGQCLQTLIGHHNWVRGISFSPNGQLLVSTSDDLTIKIWDIQTGTAQKTINSDSFPLYASFSPTGDQLATTDVHGHIKIWQVANWELCHEFLAHQGWACRVHFSPDGLQLVSCGADNLVKLWDLNNYQCLREMSGHQAWVFAVMFSPDGRRILSAGLDRTIRIWNINTGDCQNVLTGHTDWVWSAVFSPDGQQIASTGNDQTIRLWDSHSGVCQQVIAGHTHRVWSVAYHPAGDQLATGSDDQTIRLWNAQDGKCLQVIQGWRNWVLSIELLADAKHLISGHNDHIVRVWNIASKKCIQELIGHQQPVRAVATHPTLPIVVSGSDDKTMKVWHLANQSAVCSYTMSGHGDGILAVAFSPDGRLLASASGDKTIRLWRSDQNECLACLTGHQDKVLDLAFSPCGQYLATVSEDQTAKIWNIPTEQCIYNFTGHVDRVLAVAFHPDGQQVASAGQDHQIKIWNFRTNETILNIDYPSGWVLALSYSSCGRWLVNGGNDHQVGVWDAITGERLQAITQHHDWVWDVAIHPTNGSIISAGADEMIYFWQEQTREFQTSLRVARPYEDMNITAVQGLTPAQKDNLKKLGAVEIPTIPEQEDRKLRPINFRKNKERFAN